MGARPRYANFDPSVNFAPAELTICPFSGQSRVGPGIMSPIQGIAKDLVKAGYGSKWSRSVGSGERFRRTASRPFVYV
jgi:hypothetical protein